MVHQPAFQSIWPAAPSLRWGMSIDLECIYVGAVEEMKCVVRVYSKFTVSYKEGIVVMDVSWRVVVFCYCLLWLDTHI